MAAYEGSGELVRKILEYGADIEIRQHFFGYTPFHIAAIQNNIEAIDVMLEFGADINVVDNYERTSLDILVQSFKHPYLVAYLCSKGAVSNLDLDVSPIQESVFVPKENTKEEVDEKDMLTISVEGKEIKISKKVISLHSPVFAHLLSNVKDTDSKVFQIQSDYQSLSNICEWIFHGTVKTNDLSSLIKTWYTSESLMIHPLSRYLQTEKIIPLLSSRFKQKNQTDLDLLLEIHKQSENTSKGRYLERFSASMLLQRIHLLRHHKEFKDLDTEEFGDFVQRLYDKIDVLVTSKSDTEVDISGSSVTVADSPSKGLLGYLTNLISPSKKVETWDLKYFNSKKLEIPVSWKTYLLFNKSGTMTFFENYLVYGDEYGSTAIDYKEIVSFDVDDQNQSLIIGTGRSKYYFTTSEIEKLKGFQILLNNKDES